MALEYAKQTELDKLVSKIDQFVEKSEQVYARQTDLNKLTDQMERFVSSMNNLFITKELHELAQNIISDKLDDIKKILEVWGKRLENLEKKEYERLTIRRTLKRWAVGVSLVIGAVSSINFSKILKKFF